MKETGNYAYGTSVSFLLFLTFLVLKLCNVIDWSWWWIAAPLWIPLAIVLAIFLVVLLYVLLTHKYRAGT